MNFTDREKDLLKGLLQSEIKTFGNNNNFLCIEYERILKKVVKNV